MSSPAVSRDPRLSLAGLALPFPARRRLTAGVWPLALATGLGLVVFGAGGGQVLSTAVPVEIGVVSAGAGLCAAALLRAPAPSRAWGLGLLLLLGAYALVALLSISWSIVPDDSWVEANRTLAYLAALAGGVALARLTPRRADGVLAAIGLVCLAAAAYGLGTKIFPGSTVLDITNARLTAPFGYWNAAGLACALGVPALLWLGTAPSLRPWARVAAHPALGVLLLTLLLSYSRGALIAVAAGAAVWFALAPRRLRTAALALPAAAGAVAVAVWAFARPGLSEAHQTLAVRSAAGDRLGLLVLALIAVLALSGWAVEAIAARRPPSPVLRRRAGRLLGAGLALAPVAAVIVLAVSSAGLGGSISTAWHSATTPEGRSPGNGPGRLVSTSSPQGRYWAESLRIWADHRAAGAGVGSFGTVRLRYRRDVLQAQHAHGYLFQALADLGVVGIVLSLALLAAWLAATRRTLGLGRRERSRPHTPERLALAGLAAVVVTFGVHSTIDWTWFVPGLAVPALLAAGFVAGRGPYGQPTEPRPTRPTTARLLAVAAVAVLGAGAAWSAWQPQRAAAREDGVLSALEAGDTAGARSDVRSSLRIDPFAVQPLFDLAAIEKGAGRPAAARQALVRAVRLQPGNPRTWQALGTFDADRGRPELALRSLNPALVLDPYSSTLPPIVLAQRAAAAKR